MSAALPRPQGDPLTGLTMDELMGQGPFHRIEAQSFRTRTGEVKRGYGSSKKSNGQNQSSRRLPPIYMGIKQGSEDCSICTSATIDCEHFATIQGAMRYPDALAPQEPLLFPL
ncbi:hypothetical protein DUI87_34171 [Hirundo rustica rustica]|uniref:Uncharacterized protein n=1 Tax=Hirundo rustica rustica TaxID=333673 RepID=A0A3M0IM16_HIRRU|nr:hypothetical protein DUI87_34171 [Hirundo rustica rustica]